MHGGGVLRFAMRACKAMPCAGTPCDALRMRRADKLRRLAVWTSGAMRFAGRCMVQAIAAAMRRPSRAAVGFSAPCDAHRTHITARCVLCDIPLLLIWLCLCRRQVRAEGMPHHQRQGIALAGGDAVLFVLDRDRHR